MQYSILPRGSVLFPSHFLYSEGTGPCGLYTCQDNYKSERSEHRCERYLINIGIGDLFIYSLFWYFSKLMGRLQCIWFGNLFNISPQLFTHARNFWISLRINNNVSHMTKLIQEVFTIGRSIRVKHYWDIHLSTKVLISTWSEL